MNRIARRIGRDNGLPVVFATAVPLPDESDKLGGLRFAENTIIPYFANGISEARSYFTSARILFSIW
jgi:hypothetical protein